MTACRTSDKEFQVAVLGTWACREVGEDDVIVDTETTLLPGGRENWKGELRLPVPPTFYVPRGVSHEVNNGRLLFHFAASGAWSVRNGISAYAGGSLYLAEPDAAGIVGCLENQGSESEGIDRRIGREWTHAGRISQGSIRIVDVNVSLKPA